MELTPGYISHVRDLDARLRELVKPILVLKHLNWTDAHEHFFLDAWSAGRPKLPEGAYYVPDWSESLVELDKFILQADGDDPLFEFLRNTAESYANAGRMLAAVGTPAFTELSIRLYGRPDDVYDTQSFTGVDAAVYLLNKTEPLSRGRFIAPALPDVPAAEFAERCK